MDVVIHVNDRVAKLVRRLASRKTVIMGVVAVGLASTFAHAVAVPNKFAPGSPISASAVNANFAALQNTSWDAAPDGKGRYSMENIGIGTASPAEKLHVQGKIRIADKWVLSGIGECHGNDTWLRLFGASGCGYYGGMAMNDLWVGSTAYLNNGTTLFTGDGIWTAAGSLGVGTNKPASKLDVTGGCITGSMCSDARLKENIHPYEEPVLERLTRLEAKAFTWKNRRHAGLRVGVVAQDVEALFPEVVTSGDGGQEKGLDCTGLNALTIEAIKELKANNDELRRDLRQLRQDLKAARSAPAAAGDR
ncbi:MAG: tail fiber domain-containing protein [Deltaproteobacteria bacterium]|nr:tail fiber domain-containing protein [Deltaproteobacteria bacterium]